MARVALLDDYQDVALQMADWKSLPADTAVHVFRDHLHDDDTLIARLHDFDIIMAMRERTPWTMSSCRPILAMSRRKPTGTPASKWPKVSGGHQDTDL